MTMQPDSFAPDAYWTDEYEDQFRAAMGGGYPVDPQPFALSTDPVPPPPQSTMGPKGRNTIAMPGAPTAEEVPAAAVQENPFLPEEFKEQAPPLSPQEEAQIEIDQPAQLPYGIEPLEVDAVVGEAPPPWMASVAENTNGMVPGQMGAPVDPYTGINSPDRAEASNAWVKLAQQDPDEYLRQEGLAQRILDDKRRAEEAIIAREDSEREVRNSQAHVEAIQRAQQASQDLETDLAELQRQKIDPDRWMNNRNSWQTVSAFIAVIAGGLAQSAGGGRNTGLDIINKSIDDDINAQVTNLQHQRSVLDQRRGLVAEIYAQTGDLHRAQETARIAMREQAIRALEIEMQQYDPNGVAARDIAKVRLQAMADTQKQRQQYAKDRLDFETKEAELQNKRLDALAKQKKLQGGAAGVPRDPSWYANQGLLPPPGPMTEKGYDEWKRRLEVDKRLGKDDSTAGKTPDQLRKEKADADKAEIEAGKDTRERVLLDPSTGKPLLDEAGNPIMAAPTVDEAKVARKNVTDTKSSLDLIDRLAEKGKKLGPQIVKDKEAAAFETELGALQILINNALGLGVLDEGGQRKLNELTGSAPTSLSKESIAGWVGIGTSSGEVVAAKLAALGNVLEESALTRLGNPKGFSFRRRSDLPKAEKTHVDELGAKVTSSLLKKGEEPKTDLEKLNARINSAFFDPISKETERGIDRMAAWAEFDVNPNNRQVAKSYLRQWAERAIYPEARKRAADALKKLEPVQRPR